MRQEVPGATRQGPLDAARRNVPGCALIVLVFALLGGVLAFVNWQNAGAILESRARVRKVSAVVTDKGVSEQTYTDKPLGQERRRLSEQITSTRTEVSYWMNFECRVGNAVRPGTAPSLFPMDELSVWKRFEKGKTYDAWYDPALDACYLLVEEGPGGFRRQLELQFAFAGGVAALALAVFLATRRRGGRKPAPPPAR